jgi:hypothetical protein
MPRRIWFINCFLVASLLYGGTAAAQAPAPDSMAAAKELVVVMRLTDRMKEIFPVIMQAIKPAVVQNRPEVAKDFDAMLPLMVQVMNSRMDDYVALMAALYARNFTASQLREVIAFYKTPTGVLMLEKTPILMQEGLQAGQRFGAGIATELQERIRSELRKKGHNI